MTRRRQLFSILSRLVVEGTTPEIIALREQHVQNGLAWRFQGLGNWSTEAIFARLIELGIDTDEQRFHSQAQTVDGPDALHEVWVTGVEFRTNPLWEDFPFIATTELWRRLLPETVTVEVLAEELDRLSSLSSLPSSGTETSEHTEVFQRALDIIAWVRSVPLDERTDRFERLTSYTYLDLSEWLWDLFRNHGRVNPDAAITIAESLHEFTYNDDQASNQGDLADVLAKAGRTEEAKARIAANLAEHPEHFWAHVYAGDTYAWTLNEPERALSYYTTALSLASKREDWHVAKDRILEILKTLGRQREWPSIQERHPSPPAVKVMARGHGPSGEPVQLPPHLAQRVLARNFQGSGLLPRDTPTQPQRKVGRNDPCPCGSRLKYKKCCGAPGQR